MRVISSQRSVFSWRMLFVLVVFCALGRVSAVGQGLPMAAPRAVGMNPEKLAQIDALVNAEIADKKLPGAVVIVGHKGKIVFRKAFGNRSLMPTVEKMTVDTIFDVASLTKPVATATSIMILVEQGKVRLNDTIGKFIPDIDDADAKRITIQQLLTHTSGYAPDFDLKEKWTGRDGMLSALKKEKLRSSPGTKFVYSDIGFIVLGEILERVSSKRIDRFSVENIFDQLGNEQSMFVPIDVALSDTQGPAQSRFLAQTAPTENIKGQNSYLGAKFDGGAKEDESILRGKVHDPTSFRMGGVAGHAGLFSTADDLARYCQTLLNGGAMPAASKRPVASAPGSDKRVLSAQTIARMTQPYVVSEDGATRGLGWDINTSFSSNRGELFPLGSFGHTGFTGTSIWIDPTSQTFVVFMSNRVHPDGKGDVTPLRARVATVAASSIEDMPIANWKDAEARYNAAVAAQIPGFVERASAARRQAGVAGATPASQSNTTTFPAVTVLNGIDVLEKNGFKELEGKRIGLVTNHTGRNLAGKPTIDILHEAKNVDLVAIFAPEHGIRGELDTEKIDDSKDEKTGLAIYSIYKDRLRRPKPEQLKDLDAIVYDIQDVGTRFYTYTATLKNVMEEAAKAGKPVYVLDRPDPINGLSVEGPVADEDKLTFVAAHTIPVRYGMTIGELGAMMNAERKIGADLRVIKMEGWTRAMWFDETGQTWINPSPNMRSLTQATTYPGIGLLEYTNVSVGRGTDTPFEILGAPWMDGRKLAAHLNARGLTGVRFVPIKFKPNASVFKDQECGGVNIVVTDRTVFSPVMMGIEIVAAFRSLFKDEWQGERYVRLIVNQEIFDRMMRGDQPAEILKTLDEKNKIFRERRAPFLLYK
jgi:uncharacterized protein YbbC (DUF1343 family)/CubicO group peptidase (beta-lactamase class C family)